MLSKLFTKFRKRMRAEPPHLVLRADANVQIGTGHVMRCLALADAWKRAGGAATFVSACDKPMRDRIIFAGHSLLDHDFPIQKMVRKQDRCIVALDGYEFGEAYQRIVKNTGAVVVVLDDYGHASHYTADFILNQNVGAENIRYSCGPETRILRGPQYALLRDEFAAYRTWRRTTPDLVRRLLVTMGGGDDGNSTSRIIRALAKVSAQTFEAVVVVGGSNPNRALIEQAAAETGGHIHIACDITNMAEQMASADLAIAAAGTTALELAFMGLPSLLVVLAENQQRVAQAMAVTGAARNLGEAGKLEDALLVQSIENLMTNPGSRRLMSERGQALVDGNGAERVVKILREQISSCPETS